MSELRCDGRVAVVAKMREAERMPALLKTHPFILEMVQREPMNV